jgi:hypothetical protein
MKKNVLTIIGFALFNLSAFAQEINFSQKLTGVLNDKKINTIVKTSIDKESGESTSFADLSESEFHYALISIIITYKCEFVIDNPDGIISNSERMASEDYIRELTYSFEDGSSVFFETKSSLNSLEGITTAKGNFPNDFLANFEKEKELNLVKVATFDVYNSPDKSGVTYSGNAVYKIGNKEYNVKINSKYKYKVAKELNRNYKFKIESDNTTFDNESHILNKKAKFSKSL